MKKAPFDPTRIRKYDIIDGDVQFIAIGDRHQMIKHDDGSIEVQRLPEQGKDYSYFDPFPMDEAIKILRQGAHESHHKMADDLEKTG